MVDQPASSTAAQASSRPKYPKFKRIVRDQLSTPPAPNPPSEPIARSQASPTGSIDLPRDDVHTTLSASSTSNSLREVEDDTGTVVHVPNISSVDVASEIPKTPSMSDEDAPTESEEEELPVLKVNRRSKVLPVCSKFFHGRMAARGGFDRMVITTPNSDNVWAYPRETPVIETYSDGRWGMHEYSTYPQDLSRGRWHLACIPLASEEFPPCLWRSLDPLCDWTQHHSLGFNGLGFLRSSVSRDLDQAARDVIKLWEVLHVPPHVKKYANFLITILTQTLDRMTHLPSSSTVAVAVAAHVQRISLELLGLKIYMQVVVPRLESSVNNSKEVLNVVGAFVRDAADAASLFRVGVPIWFLQPHTNKLPIWQVVDVSFPRCSDRASNPPIFQASQHIAGVANLAGAWQRDMVLAVSKHLAGRCMASLSLAEAPDIPAEPARKRLKGPEPSLEAGHLGMRVAKVAASSGEGQHKPRRRRRGGKGSLDVHSPPDAPKPVSDRPAPAGEPVAVQPAKSFVPSAFVNLAPSWEFALRANSPVAPSPASALYFYPPPFLLDTISSRMTWTPAGGAPVARKDEKVHRYLHNYIRIRDFLRARILDPSLSNDPLSIAEWRSALWGDYQARTHAPVLHGSASDHRRARRRQEGHNGMSQLFSRVAQVQSYTEDANADWDGQTLGMQDLRECPLWRTRILWECHETNFRAELMALDTALVHRPTWWEIHRWTREALVTTVWGSPSSVVTVVPRVEDQDRVYRWWSHSSEGVARDTLKAFVTVLSRWPGSPATIVSASSGDFGPEMFKDVQEAAVQFYVRTFVMTFHRLPIAPVPFPA